MHANIVMSRIVLSDFNQILDVEDKKGGSNPNCYQMAYYRNVLLSLNLHDMSFRGQSYTWKRGKLLERLDRGFCNPS